MTRIGIELSPDACRIAEIDLAPAWARRRGGETRVRSFAILPPSGPETDAKLQTLRKRRAAVVVWTAGSDHRQVVVSPGSYESMRTEATGALAAAGVATRGVWVDISPAARAADGAARRPVVITLASGSEITALLQPLVAAGIDVRTVMTPAAALTSLARLRRASSTPAALEVFVAFEERATCIALMRSGVLMGSKDLGWGYVNEFGSGLEPRNREEIAARLVAAITEFAAAVGGGAADINQVCVCGGHPELRSMTAPLMEQLDVEVEPLDSLFGIDAAHLPEPADEFRERSADLRLAWAAAADVPPSINLLRARHRQVAKTMLARAAVVTGVAAGLMIGWRIQSRWTAPVPTMVARSAATLSPDGGRATATPPTAATNAPRALTPPAVAANRTPPVTLPANSPPPVVTPPPVVSKTTPPIAVPPAASANRMPTVTLPPFAANRPPPAPAPPAVAANRISPVVPPTAGVANRTTPMAPPPVAINRTPPAVPPPVVAASKTPPVVPPAPAAANRTSPIVPPAPAAANRTPPGVVPPPAPAVSRAPAAAPPVANSTPPAVASRTAPVITPEAPPTQARSTIAPPPLAPRQEPRQSTAVPQPPIAPTARAAPAQIGQEPVRARARPVPPSEVALPFDAVIGTILYSPDRQLAIIDGHIVGPGDEVRGARIIDITPGTVMLRDGQGRLRRLTMGSGQR